MTTPLSTTHIRQLLTLLHRLEPEQLAQDGECSRAQVRRTAHLLRAQWQAIEAQVGRPISEDEVWALADATSWAR